MFRHKQPTPARLRSPRISHFSSTSFLLAHRAVVYRHNGQPSDVLTATTFPTLPPPRQHWINIKYILSPINPADINVIEGVYPSKPSPLSSWWPDGSHFDEPLFVAGNEGLAEVTAVGSGVHEYKKGDRVVLTAQQSGTWASARTIPAQFVTKVPEEFSDVNAATVTVNPSTAYNMLHTFVKLEAGEWIVQNGANSAVGQAVIQIAKRRGWKTFNFVRNRPDVDLLKARLYSLGADVVMTYEDLADKTLRDQVKTHTGNKPIRLLLNGVGGKIIPRLVGLLGSGANVVTYGGMSKEPIPVATSSLIFKDIQYRGFWQTRWYKENTLEARQDLMRELARMNLQEPEHEVVTLPREENDEGVTRRVKDLFVKMSKGQYGRKVLLKVEDPHD
ncbi:NAD-binding protein [Cristinia sonorae]|uniref:enoyl-[acyl-carrier-protein] reductase n=1 Tax=Cristinia sonorae TaxID=1940300 RepID=A0A8K0UKV0_9AGAR|nr:NAD-binding protein [Cristinia sonorae]